MRLPADHLPSAVGIALRPAGPADVEPTWVYRQRADVTEWLPSAAPDLETYARAFVSSPRLERTLVVEIDGRVVGDLYLHVHDAWAQAEVADAGGGAEAEIGWVIDPAVGGRGWATAAVDVLLRHCFDDLLVHRVVARCHTANERSWRLMERVGMRREAHLRRAALHRTEGWIDGYTYALLAEEWRDRG